VHVVRRGLRLLGNTDGNRNEHEHLHRDVHGHVGRRRVEVVMPDVPRVPRKSP
jgi:hypothetical protein